MHSVKAGCIFFAKNICNYLLYISFLLYLHLSGCSDKQKNKKMREIIYVDIDDMDVKFFNWGAEVKYFTPDCDLEYLLVFDCERLNKADRELWNDDSTPFRSEEHTSELQSRGHLVCRLLLEKN